MAEIDHVAAKRDAEFAVKHGGPAWAVHVARAYLDLAVRQVPREPTEAMIRAGNMMGFKLSLQISRDVWRAMWDAAQAEQIDDWDWSH